MKRSFVFGAAIAITAGGCGAILGLSEQTEDPQKGDAGNDVASLPDGEVPDAGTGDSAQTADAPACTSTNEPNNCGACGRRCSLDAGCTNGKCQRRIVFLTKKTFTGNGFGGTQADALCRAIAQDAGLSTGTWKVWLGGNRFNEQQNHPVYLVTGERVADKWPPGVGANNENLTRPINVDETGDEIGGQNVRVWTDLDPGGSVRPVNNCLDWKTLNPGNQQGGYGQANLATMEWTVGPGDLPCTSENHLYCVEDP